MKIKALIVVVILTVVAFVQPAQALSDTAPNLLSYLQVQPESSSAKYSRDFFKHWVDEDKDGCDSREEVLIAESRVKAKTGKGCSLISGKWSSLYDSKTFIKASSLDIDHMVPLKEAWDSGASSWSADDRQAFSNDLGFAGSLIAVSASTNRSKGDKDPAQWMPPNKSFKCTYAVTWIQVKFRWSLSVDEKESAALKKELASCPKTKKFALPEVVAISSPEAAPSGTASPTPSATPTPPGTSTATDPRFSSCAKAKAAGYGPYIRGADPEYPWYQDRDKDGIVCE